MPDIRYSPKRKSKTPEWILTVCAVLLIACVLFLAFRVGKKLVWQTLFLLTAVVMIWVATRYMTMAYTYEINRVDGCFIVTQRQGRRLICLCRLDLAFLYLVRRYESRDDNAPGATRYAYCLSPRPEETYLLFFRQEEKTVSVRIEATGEFVAQLSDIAAANALATTQEPKTDNSDETERT